MKECFLCKTNIDDNDILCSSCDNTFTEISGEDIKEISSMVNLTELLPRIRNKEPRDAYFYDYNSNEYKKLSSEELLHFLREFKLDSAALGLQVADANVRAINACSITLSEDDQTISKYTYPAMVSAPGDLILANTNLKKAIKAELDKRGCTY